MNLKMVKSQFVINKLPTLESVPYASFMDTLEQIDNEYNDTFSLWIIIVIIRSSTKHWLPAL